MRWLIRGLVAIVALVVVLLGVGFALPSHFKVERVIEINASAERVYSLIEAPAQWKLWTVWNQRDPAMQMRYAGPERGVGARWSWQSKTEGSGEMTFTGAAPNERLDYTLVFPEFEMQSQGSLRITPAGTGVRVAWSNEGDMGGSPINRWFALFMDRLVGPDFEAGLANLKRVAEAR